MQCSFLVGVPWGLAMGLVWWSLLGEPPVTIIFWLMAGCLVFGPMTAWGIPPLSEAGGDRGSDDKGG